MCSPDDLTLRKNISDGKWLLMNDQTVHYHKLFEKMPDAFAYHQVVFDGEGTPVDYLFLEVNRAFEKLTGIERAKVIGRKVTEVHPEIGDLPFDWIGIYGQVASGGKSIRFEQYFEPAERWYDVSAFSDSPGFFAVSFREVTTQKNENKAFANLIDRARDIMHFPAGHLDYQVIADGLLEISEAKYAAVNLYDQDSHKSVTKAIAGVSTLVEKFSSLLGFELVGKEWDIIPERVNAIKEGQLLYFKNLYDSASGAISPKMAALLERLAGIGSVYVVHICHEEETLGDMIMFMPRHKILVNPQIIEIYAALIASALVRFKAGEARREVFEQYRSLVDNLPGTSYRCLYDENWTMIYMGSDVDNITGYPSSDFINNKVRSYASVICKDDNNNDAIIARAIKAGETWDIEYRVIHSDGSVRWVHERGRGVPDEEGNVICIDGLILDITDRKKIEGQLKESELRHRALVEAIPDLLFRYNSDGFYLDAVVKNKNLLHERAQKIYGNENLVGKNIVEVLPEGIAKILLNGIKETLSSGEIRVLEYSYPIKNKEYYFEARLAPIGDKEVVSIVRDISERKSYLSELEHISLHDQLTGLYNRHYFKNELERLSRSRDYPITIVSADLDGLKLVNDTLGHAEGDRYLQNGAELLKGALRSSDILARVGGDEFALILPRTDREAAEELVARLRARIDQFNSKQQGLPISISIGFAVSPASESSLEETYKEADNAMYKDKLKRSQLARAAIVDSLVNALSTRNDLGEGNSTQVQDLAEQFGRHLQLGENALNNLQTLAKVYDLGKVNMPDQLVHSSLKEKEGELTGAEREAIRRHPEIGYRIASSSPELSAVADLILHHHENYDGSGYPLGLKDDEIALECLILAIVIAYSAMTNHRPYAKKLKPMEALEELKRCAGSQFDPQLVEEFIALISSDPT
jgi:diguanylate cyclase (GGDEF)-like protein/PAS domain S-box-containing protein